MKDEVCVCVMVNLAVSTVLSLLCAGHGGALEDGDTLNTTSHTDLTGPRVSASSSGLRTPAPARYNSLTDCSVMATLCVMNSTRFFVSNTIKYSHLAGLQCKL